MNSVDMPLFLAKKRHQSESEIESIENELNVKIKRKCGKNLNDKQQIEKSSEKMQKIKTKTSVNMKNAMKAYQLDPKLKLIANKFKVPTTSLKRQLEVSNLYQPSKNKKMEFKATKKEKENLLKEAMQCVKCN